MRVATLTSPAELPHLTSPSNLRSAAHFRAPCLEHKTHSLRNSIPPDPPSCIPAIWGATVRTRETQLQWILTLSSISQVSLNHPIFPYLKERYRALMAGVFLMRLLPRETGRETFLTIFLFLGERGKHPRFD